MHWSRRGVRGRGRAGRRGRIPSPVAADLFGLKVPPAEDCLIAGLVSNSSSSDLILRVSTAAALFSV